MNGKLNHKIIIKKDYQRADGTHSIYLQLIQSNGIKSRIKRIPLGLSVPLKYFDCKKQMVKSSFKFSKDYNLIIGKVLGDLNKILVNYRLSDRFPTIENVVRELTNPSIRINYNAFAKEYLANQKQAINESTYRQQKGALAKIKRFKDPIYFSEIDAAFLKKLKYYCKNELGNSEATVESTVKNFKKFLRAANDHGIKTTLHYTDISVKKMVGQRTFLLPEELKKVYDYYNSSFINDTHKKVLKRYLFSCFTGIRLSDSEQLTEMNFIGNYLAFTMYKTKKFIRIPLNKTAQSFIALPKVFDDGFAREHINRELKVIAKVLGIKKRLYFHSSRHTFATNFLIKGGDVVTLQKLLGHSKIEETMIYVHIVDSIMDKQINLLDSIVG